MPPRSSLRLASAAVALLASVPSIHAVVPNRVATTADSGRGTLSNTIPGRARRSADLGQASLTRVLSSVTLHFNMSSAQQIALNQLMIDQQNPASPRYHQWLTPTQYGAQFGLSSSDLARVSAWLTAQGLQISAVSPSSNFITVSGTVAQIQTALGTSIHTLSLDGENHISNITDPVLPASISSVLNGITGLNDFKLKSRSRFATVVQPRFTSSLSSNHYIAPGDFYTIYDVAPLLSSSINGSGITIAVMGQTDIALSDVAAFRSAAGLTANAPTVRTFGTDPGTQSGDLPEAMLDVEWSGAVAPSASILYVNSNDVIGQSLINSVTGNLAPILSISYGACESDWGQANLTTLNQYFQQANVQGQTIVGPAGDSGATDCDYQSAQAADGLAVDFPASSPFVTGAGGTMLNDGAGTYWGTTNNSNGGSATGYIPEASWNESSTTNGLASGGGGVSAYFSKPAWQIGAGVPSDMSRDVPDIALSSSYLHDGYLYCHSGSCVNGFRASDGQTLSVVGGTSVAAPSFAGILALVEQKVGSRLGNANPQLYGLANSTYYNNVFHDITTGTNNSACVQGSPNCPAGGAIGYSAGVGYDLNTGLGSVDAYNLATKWTLAAPAGAGNSVGSTLTKTTVSTTAATCGLSSGSLALSIAVTNVVQGSTAVPTGAVQILVDNVASGTPVTIANGAATFTLNTAALTSGGHTVSAVYVGDSTFAGSKGSLLTDVVSTTQPDFSITPCTSPVTVASGATSSGTTFTVNPFNGFTGSVAFTASADATLSASYSFSVSPVVISGASGGTTVLTLIASQTPGSTSTGFNKLSSTGISSNNSARHAVYTAGSGIAIASLLLLTLPRRRRWAGLLAVVISVGVIGAGGCGGGGSLVNPGNVTPTPTSTAAAPGNYTVTVTAIASTASGNRVHSTQVNLVVR